MRIGIGDIVDKFATYGSGYAGMGTLECQNVDMGDGTTQQICGELNLDPNQVFYAQGGQSTQGVVLQTLQPYSVPGDMMLGPAQTGYNLPTGPLPPAGYIPPTCPAGYYPTGGSTPGNVSCLSLPATIQPTGMTIAKPAGFSTTQMVVIGVSLFIVLAMIAPAARRR